MDEVIWELARKTGNTLHFSRIIYYAPRILLRTRINIKIDNYKRLCDNRSIMIEALKLKNHKGIKEIRLPKLGHINVISGRNNSGKTSTLEAINDETKRFIGKKITPDNSKELLRIFEPVAHGYSTPDPRLSLHWFNQILPSLLNEFVYEDEFQALGKTLGDSFHRASHHGPGTFNFQEILRKFCSYSFKSLLISPKRELNCNLPAGNISADIPTECQRILNRLFSLSTRNDQDLSRKIFEKISEAFTSITNGYRFHISYNNNSKQIQLAFSNKPGTWISAENSGLGFRDLLVILCALIDTDQEVILVEEPENHIHPDIQRRLLKFIKDIRDKQIFLTTHSNVFLDPTYVDTIYYVRNTNGEVTISDETSRANILSDLGYSVADNLVSDIIILTEGPTDIPIVKEICRKLGFLDQYNIKFYPLGGDIMHHVDIALFKEHCKVLALVDSDPGSKNVRKLFKENCDKHQIPLQQLKKYAIENYFSLRAIKEVYPGQEIPKEVTKIEGRNKVEDQLGFSVKREGKKIIEAMTLEELQDTDLLQFCKDIKQTLEAEKLPA